MLEAAPLTKDYKKIPVKFLLKSFGYLPVYLTGGSSLTLRFSSFYLHLNLTFPFLLFSQLQSLPYHFPGIQN